MQPTTTTSDQPPPPPVPVPAWAPPMPFPMVPQMVPHFPQQFVPYPQPHQFQGFHHHPVQPPPPPPHGGGGGEDNKVIWVGDLGYWMDESYLHSCFAHTGEVVSIKVIRNKQTGQSEGYGFVEFLSHATAEKVLQTYNGAVMPNTETFFRLNWASFSMGEKRENAVSDLSIFVGDLASDVTDALLQDTFSSKYPSVKGAKVVIDANTGRSKGYGFVRFGEESEKTQALSEMNGIYCSTRPMRIAAATPRKSSGGFASNGSQGNQGDGDSSNTTVFVGGLDPDAKEEDLRQAFAQYGEISSIKIPAGKQCGFVQFVNRNDAEEALQKLNGVTICKQAVRLSWGRNPANKQMRGDSSSQWNDQYYSGPVYDGFGYGVPHDPSMYAAAAYGAYPMYGSQQQVS